MSEQDILKSYPTVNADDLVAGWLYVANNREEIAAAIKENE